MTTSTDQEQDQMPPIDDNEAINRRPAMDEIDEVVPVPQTVTSPSPPPRAPRRQPGYTLYSHRQSEQSKPLSPEAELMQAMIDREIIRQQLQIQEEPWIKSYWRPAMGWLYMLICLVDFVIFPAIVMILPAVLKNFGIQAEYEPWQSLTLTNGGLMHIAFGAILGISAWTRGKEKMIG